VGEESLDEEGRLASINFKPTQTVARMDKPSVEEVSISGQQCRSLESPQKWHNIVIVHSLAAEVARDGSKTNSPLLQ
jgi:hypothetical protein